jgi:uncharacterized membrane protein YidH (DUF202 family)
MIRLLILRLLVVGLPFAVYALWRLVQRMRGRHQGRLFDQAPTVWLLAIGLVLAALSLMVPVLFVPATVGP